MAPRDWEPDNGPRIWAALRGRAVVWVGQHTLRWLVSGVVGQGGALVCPVLPLSPAQTVVGRVPSRRLHFAIDHAGTPMGAGGHCPVCPLAFMGAVPCAARPQRRSTFDFVWGVKACRSPGLSRGASLSWAVSSWCPCLPACTRPRGSTGAANQRILLAPGCSLASRPRQVPVRCTALSIVPCHGGLGAAPVRPPAPRFARAPTVCGPGPGPRWPSGHRIQGQRAGPLPWGHPHHCSPPVVIVPPPCPTLFARRARVRPGASGWGWGGEGAAGVTVAPRTLPPRDSPVSWLAPEP